MLKKTIVIKNDKDLEKFYKRLKFYRSLYLFTIFESSNKEIQEIIKALNIKRRCKRIRYIYETACKELDDYYEKINPCEFKNCICIQDIKYGCCRCCLYASDKGCTTSNLSCKFFFCTVAKAKCKKVLEPKDIKILKVLPYRCQIILRHNFFTKKEDFLMDLYIGSIIIFCIRCLYRFLKNNLVRFCRQVKIGKKSSSNQQK